MRPGPIRPGGAYGGAVARGFNEARADSPGRYEQQSIQVVRWVRLQ